MNDGANPTPGTLSPRNVDTINYSVVGELPEGLPRPGGHMAIWPQGEVLVNINGGLRNITQKMVRNWEKSGLIVRVSRGA